MTLEDLANVGEVFGGLAVLISLAYLILEVRRNTSSVRSSAAWNSDVAFAEMNEALSQHPQLAELCMRAAKADARREDFSPSEWAQLFYVSRACLQKVQAQWYLWTQGSLPDDLWQSRRRWTKAFVSLPVISEFWELERNQHVYVAAFVESVESATLSGDLDFSLDVLRQQTGARDITNP